jgi:hypothetical protein
MRVKQLKKEITFGKYQKENVKSTKERFKNVKTEAREMASEVWNNCEIKCRKFGG